MTDRPSYDKPGEALAVHAPVVPPLGTLPLSSLHASAQQPETPAQGADGQQHPSRLFSPRPRSDAGSSRLRIEGRAGSTPHRTGPYMGAVAVAKAAQESTILAAIRRQMEALEEKLGGQIVRVQQQGDRLRDAAFSRMDAKMGTMETMQPKFDRKLAELSGNYKGLSDEMQAQIRRIDQMDTRLWEWRHQVEDEVRTKFAEVEQGNQQMSSSIRLANATSEDAMKRLTSRIRRLEGLVEERLTYSDETSQNLAALDARLQEVEAARIHELTLAPQDSMSSALMLHSQTSTLADLGASNNPSISALEAKLSEACRKIELTSKESQEMQTRVEAQEERLRSLRTSLDSKEEHLRHSKFDRQDFENKSKELQALVGELDKQRVSHSELLEVFRRRFEHHDKSYEEVGEQIRNLQERSYYNMSVPVDEAQEAARADIDASSMSLLSPGPNSAMAQSLEDVPERLRIAEERLAVINNELAGVRSDADLGPRVAVLVESLKQVAPKVMDQEASVQELHEKLGQMEAKVSIADNGKKHDSLVARMVRLENDVGRLKVEIEGADSVNRIESGAQGGPLESHTPMQTHPQQAY